MKRIAEGPKDCPRVEVNWEKVDGNCDKVEVDSDRKQLKAIVLTRVVEGKRRLHRRHHVAAAARAGRLSPEPI